MFIRLQLIAGGDVFSDGCQESIVAGGSGSVHNPWLKQLLSKSMSVPFFSLDQLGTHERELREAIGQFDMPDNAAPAAGPVTIMLFTNRSGSSMVAEHLRATGRFRGMGEPLNPGTVLSAMRRDGIETFFDYLQSRVDRNVTSQSMFGMKASLQQVLMLIRAGIIPGYFQDVRWVFVQRHNVAAQAVSFEIASQTKRWESFSTETGAQPEYRFESIRKKMQAISLQNAAINAFFSVMDTRPCRIYYEDFTVNTVEATARLASGLGVDGARVDVTCLRRRKQADATNVAYLRRFRLEYAAWLQGIRG